MFLTDVDKAELPHNVSRTLYIYIYIYIICLSLKNYKFSRKKEKKKTLKNYNLVKNLLKRQRCE